jgi:hypothetical protein
MKFLKDENGQTLVLTVLAMTVVLGFIALAIDVGMLFRAKRNLQTAADAAATAGALDYYYYQSATSARTMGCNAAAANGVSGTCTTGACGSGGGAQICINVPPQYGPIKSGNFVEAVINQPNPTVFMSIFGYGSVAVAAKAVAGLPGNSSACVWLMDSAMSRALDLKGNGTVDATNCGVYVNSNSSSAVSMNGHTSINAASLVVVGNDTGAANVVPGHTRINAPPQTPPIPLNLPGIPSTGCTSTITQSEITLSTNGGSKISEASAGGSSANNVVCFTNAGGVTIDDGVVLPGAAGNGVLYVFENGVNLSGAVTLGSATYTNGQFSNTLGATLDLAGGSLNQGNAALSIYAPTSGAYNGIALMQPTTNTTGGVHCPSSPVSPCLLIQRGSSGSVFDGIVYAPGAYVELQDHAGAVYATGLIADGLFVKASDLILSGYSQSNPTTTPFKVITLVE